MTRTILGALSLLLAITNMFAQADLSSSLWLFGNGVRIDFRTAPPTVTTQAGYSASEGTATVCDSATGLLKFYSDGRRIFGANGSLVTENASIANASTTQAALIVPIPNVPNRYTLFTVEDASSAGRGFYIEVTVAADGSITTSGWTQFASALTEKLTAARHCNGRDYWVLYKHRDGRIAALPVGSTGPRTTETVVSAGLLAVTSVGMSRGEMKVSPDGRWLAAVNEQSGTELYAFNNSTGQITNGRVFDAGQMQYGCCFSPNSRLLYTNNGWTSRPTGNSIYQFDLFAADVVASRVVVGTTTENIAPGLMQVAPDGRLYIAMVNQTFLGAIESPNTPGVAATYTEQALVLANGSLCVFGLPNFPQNIFIPQIVRRDTTVCEGSQVALGTTALQGYTYRWFVSGNVFDSTSANPVITADRNRRYVGVATDDRGCSITQDVRITVNPLPTIDNLVDTIICPSTAVTLAATVPAGATAQWDPHPTLSTTNGPTTVATPAATTTYRLTVTSAEGCVTLQDVTVTIRPISPPRLSPNGTVDLCQGESVLLRTGLSSGTFVWNDGSSDSVLLVTSAGTYSVRHIDTNGCISTDTVTVRQLLPPVLTTTTDTTICMSASVSLTASGAESYIWSGPFLASTSGASVTAQPQTDTTYTVVGIAANGCRDTATIRVSIRPRLDPDIGARQRSICPCDSVVIVVPDEVTTLRWDDLSVDRRRVFRGQQQRLLRGQDAFGCDIAPVTLTIDTIVTDWTSTVTIDRPASRDGERVSVGIRIDVDSSALPCYAISPTAQLSLASTILAPANDASRGSVDATGIRTIRIQLEQRDTSFFAAREFIATLGVDSVTTFTIDHVDVGVLCRIAGNSQPSTFTLEEICQAGGVARLFRSPPTAILGLWPNPTSSDVVVRVRNERHEQLILYVDDVLGQRRFSRSIDASSSVNDVSLSFDNLPTGRYRVIVVSSTSVHTTALEVVR